MKWKRRRIAGTQSLLFELSYLTRTCFSPREMGAVYDSTIKQFLSHR